MEDPLDGRTETVQLRRSMRKAISALLALLMVGAAVRGAAATHGPGSEVLSGPLQAIVDVDLPFAEAFLSVKDLRGYALADELDKIAREPRVVDFFIRCSNLMSEMSHAEMTAILSDSDLESLIHPSLVAKVERLSSLIDVMTDIVASMLTHLTDEEDGVDLFLGSNNVTTGMFLAQAARIDDRGRPVAERRMLRHSLRGISALYCIAAQPSSLSLQNELLDHAIVGYESLLRLAAGSAQDAERERIVALGLEPANLQEWNRRAERLGAARAALDEACAVESDFRLPPHPAFIEEPKD